VIIEFEGEKFEKDDIRQLYPAAMIPTGVADELTQISLEWYDTEDSGIEAKKWAIFIHLADKSVLPFYYQTREKLENAIEKLANVLNS
jgi:hypothetical protein